MNDKSKLSVQLLCISTFVFYGLSFAQKSDDAPIKRFGFTAGTNISNMNFNKGYPAPAIPIKATWKAGISIGVLLSVPLVEDLFLQPEYYYTQREGADKSTAINYSLQYFSLPLLLNYTISPRFAVVAGPQAELLIHAGADSNGTKHNITHDVEERSLGAVVGLNVKLINSFFISARYFQGLNHIGVGQRSAVKEFKYEAVSLSVGIGF